MATSSVLLSSFNVQRVTHQQTWVQQVAINLISSSKKRVEMVFVYTSYKEDSELNVIDRDSAFPIDVSCITICADRSKYMAVWDSDDTTRTEYECGYEELASMIQRSPAKIPDIDVCGVGIEETSPEYLALMVAILNKSISLRFDTLGGDAAYACFMGSMFQPNGLRELAVGSTTVLMSTYHAKSLFEGIAVSQSLEKLDLYGNFAEPAEATSALASALKRNNSLTTLDLYVNVEDGGTELRDLFEAAIADKNMLELSMCRKQGEQQLPFDVMAEVLCTDKCTVKKLEFATMEPTAEVSNGHIEYLQNTSVTHYTAQDTSLDCFRIMETVGLFNSIKELNLAHNQISDLSPLDPLLVGDNLTLETLELVCNRIDEKDAIEFFCKIPKMTCLRKVSLVWNPFITSSESWKDVLADAAWHNRSLDCIYCTEGSEDNTDNAFPELNVPLSLNRGGRRALELEPSTPLPANLWPHVLERAGNLSYFSTSDDIDEESEESPSLESTRPDVVYWLLKEKMLGSCLHG